ncbi:MAG: PAS domain S-box protein [Bdellovibrionales bacterium]|nr:PAS domain S-box protein [Bdellovibrionales bacterium]
MVDQRLFTLIGSLSDAGHRMKASKKIAQSMGADDLIIFAKDPVLGILLPAPGFPQTLPNGNEWKKFVQSCTAEAHFSANLKSPYTKSTTPVIGIKAPDDSVLALLGGNPDLVLSVEITAIIPLIVAAFYNEQISSISRGELEVETLNFKRIQALSEALDSTRRTLEEELRKSNSILNSITDAFFALDNDWRFTEVNLQAETLLGKTRKDLIDKKLWDLYPEALGSNSQINYERAIREQHSLRFEEFFPLHKRWYEVRAYPSPHGLAVYFTDISERILAAEEIKQSHEWFQTTLRSIGDAVIAVDVERKVTFINKVAEELTGWTQDEAKGQLMEQVFHIIHETSRKPAPNPVERVLKEGIVVGLANHTALIRRDGKEFIIEDSAAPIKDSTGKITGVVLVFRDVTDDYAKNKKLQETYSELQSEKSRFNAILQQMPEGVLIAEPSGKLILRNAQMDEMLGGFLPCEDIEEYGQYKGYKKNGEPYLSHEWPLARSLLKGEIVQNEEIQFDRLDGTQTIISTSSAPIKNEHGNIIASVVVIHDISQEKQLEADLRHQNYLTKTITDNAASCLFMMDKKGHPTFMNPAAMKVTGYSSLEEIKDKPLHYAVHWKKPDGSHYPMEECPIDNAQAELKKVQNQEEIFCTKDGRLFPVSYSISPLERNGEVIGSVLEFRDITEQKFIESEFHSAISERDQSLETLEKINKVGQRVTAELNMEKLTQQVTDDATRLTGAHFGAFFYFSSDVQGNSLLLNVVSGVPKEAFSKFPNPRATAVFAPTFKGEGTVRSADITKDARFGHNAPYNGLPPGHLPVKSYLAVSVISRTGEIIGGLFFGHAKENVFTEQAEKIAEGLASQAAVAMDNARLYRRVQESVKMRDDFMSIASHELKTPLTSLKLQSQMRTRKLKKDELSSFNKEALYKMFESDSRQIERLARLIDDMLDISRINTGKLSIQPESFDLCNLVRDVTERYSTHITDYGSTLKLDCVSGINGNWDKFRLEQVVTNLLTNALRYGQGKPIAISVSTSSDTAVLSVSDEGIGIAKENQKRIFDRFERAISANEISGLGLGLFIVKQIVEMHQGSVEVVSELGKGAKFIITLPLRPKYE